MANIELYFKVKFFKGMIWFSDSYIISKNLFFLFSSLYTTNNVKIKHENNDESNSTTDFFKLKDEVSLKIDENLDIKTENVKLRHQNESLITEMTIMKSALEKKSRILALRNAEIALLDPDRCIMEWQK